MNIWHDISPKRIKKDRFYAVIEISKGGKNKYELDKETGMLKLDRVLFTSTHYPANYGFIPRTYASDNDPLDVLVLCSEKIQPMTIVECFPIGVLWKTAAQGMKRLLPFLLMTLIITDIQILISFLLIGLRKSSISLRFIKLLSMKKQPLLPRLSLRKMRRRLFKPALTTILKISNYNQNLFISIWGRLSCLFFAFKR